jgi:hypothetical protein
MPGGKTLIIPADREQVPRFFSLRGRAYSIHAHLTGS